MQSKGRLSGRIFCLSTHFLATNTFHLFAFDILLETPFSDLAIVLLSPVIVSVSQFTSNDRKYTRGCPTRHESHAYHTWFSWLLQGRDPERRKVGRTSLLLVAIVLEFWVWLCALFRLMD